MHLIRAATLTVTDLGLSKDLYQTWLKYNDVESGVISRALARSWGADNVAGLPYSVMQPRSGKDVYLRLIEHPEPDNYVPLRTHGWAAIEINNQDTLSLAESLKSSPFDIIGPPKELDGMPAIFPMQIKGPDGEIVYLTEIRSDLPEYDLPRAASPVDQLFILVMACSDMDVTGSWFETYLKLSKGRSIDIEYTMINQAFDLPAGTKHTIATLKHGRDVFLEIDQYPKGATPRKTHDGLLPPCAAIGSFVHPEFDALVGLNQGQWITEPTSRDGVIYKGKRAGTLRDPDGTLIEIIES